MNFTFVFLQQKQITTKQIKFISFIKVALKLQAQEGKEDLKDKKQRLIKKFKEIHLKITKSTIKIKMKGQLSVNPVFTSLGIYRSVVHLKKPVVATDHHQLHFNGKSIPWDNTKTIINCTFLQKYQTLLLLCDDWKLYVYNQNLDQVARLLNWESKYTVGFQYIQKLSILLMIGVGQVQVLKININTNIKKTKFLSSVKFAIQKQQHIREDPKTKLKWNKGYGYDLQNNLLFTWSLQDINFYSLNKLELKSQIRSLVKNYEPITYVYFNTSYKYTVTGLLNGNVRVWRLPLILSSVSKATSIQDYILIHECNYHTKMIQKIVATQDDRVIFSQSQDLTVCLWSLQTFQLLRVYNFEGEYQKIMLYDYHGALAVKDNFLGYLEFGKTMEFITELYNNRIVSHDKTFERMLKLDKNSQLKNSIQQTLLTLSSNMGMYLKNQCFNQKDLNKMDIGMFYPPLKSQQIRQVISCPFIQNRYYILTETGKIYKIRMQGLSSIIEYYYSVNLTHDVQNHPLHQNPTFIKFLRIIPAEFDSQIIQSAIIDTGEQSNNVPSELSLQRKLTQQESMQQKFQSLKLIAVGCNKGSIIFLPIQNMDHIYTRITYHRQQIVSMETVYQPSIKNSYLVSICAQKYMKFVKFQNDKAHCFRTIFLENSLNFIRAFEDRLAVVLFKGLFEVMKFQNYEQSSDELIAVDNYDTLNHQGDILSLDMDLQKQIILTGAKDNKIKIWTYYKILLYEIDLDQGLRYAIFSNNYQILVSHNQKLLYIRDIPFEISKQQVDQWNNQFLQKNINNLVTIQQVLGKKTKDKQANQTSIKKQSLREHPLKNQHSILKHDSKILNQNSQKFQVQNINDQYDRLKLQISTEKKVSQIQTQKKISQLNSARKISQLQSENKIIQAQTQRKILNKGNSGRKQHVSFIGIEQPFQLFRPEKVQGGIKPSNIKQSKRQYSTTSRQSSISKQAPKSYRQSHSNSFVDATSITMTKQHLYQLQSLKHKINRPILPRITAQKSDIFDEFMKQKLLNKKTLTRRDITLNRIIMKNIVKQSIGDGMEKVVGLKVDF